MEIPSRDILQIEAVNRSACSRVPAHTISRRKEPTRLGRSPIFFIVVLSVCGIRARVASGQNELLVRFQSPARGEIVSRYADGTLTVEGAADLSSGKWWTGTYSVKLSDLDFENVNIGTLTTEPGPPPRCPARQTATACRKKASGHRSSVTRIYATRVFIQMEQTTASISGASPCRNVRAS